MPDRYTGGATGGHVHAHASAALYSVGCMPLAGWDELGLCMATAHAAALVFLVRSLHASRDVMPRREWGGASLGLGRPCNIDTALNGESSRPSST
eukprot:scaffold2810_cov39-Phaeocystis_antarctica.AAC.2